jgi:hypothetical protein
MAKAMGQRRAGRWTRGRSAFVALAFLSLALQLMFPAGFMAAAAGQATHGLPLVICTGQGQIVADWDSVSGGESHEKHAPAKSMAACPFAGHAVADTAAEPPIVAAPATYAQLAAAPLPGAVSIGLGLAAPPPPSQGPPRLA